MKALALDRRDHVQNISQRKTMKTYSRSRSTSCRVVCKQKPPAPRGRFHADSESMSHRVPIGPPSMHPTEKVPTPLWRSTNFSKCAGSPPPRHHPLHPQKTLALGGGQQQPTTPSEPTSESQKKLHHLDTKTSASHVHPISRAWVSAASWLVVVTPWVSNF